MPAKAGIQGNRAELRPLDSRLRGSDGIGKKLMPFSSDGPSAGTMSESPPLALEIRGLAKRFERPAVDGKATAYVCRHFVCQLPVTDPVALAGQLDAGV